MYHADVAKAWTSRSWNRRHGGRHRKPAVSGSHPATSYDVGRDNVLYVHLTLVPYIGAAGELKTKPTQHSVNKLREIGINRTFCCAARIATFRRNSKRRSPCLQRRKDAVITAKDVETIYEVPIVFLKEGLG